MSDFCVQTCESKLMEEAIMWNRKNEILKLRAGVMKKIPKLWHNFGFFFITQSLGFKISFFQFHMIVCSIGFGSHV